ncbi:gluconokinase [Rubrivirga sp. IMCC43871]|uniref:gluconokinase n=1 Tax=Rubrivirga sp. IMCC43871 TaxID=3391575 RepID=UPI00398FE8C2
MPAPRVVLLMGVSASGKSALGAALAGALGWTFEDADDYHSPASLAKMSRGEGLTDDDRAPWLARLAALVDRWATEGPPTVLACSALRQRYRDTLGADRPDVAAFWLDVPTVELAHRLRSREGHVAGPDLLPSQLATFEPPASGRLDGSLPIAALVDHVIARLALGGDA